MTYHAPTMVIGGIMWKTIAHAITPWTAHDGHRARLTDQAPIVPITSTAAVLPRPTTVLFRKLSRYSDVRENSTSWKLASTGVNSTAPESRAIWVLKAAPAIHRKGNSTNADASQSSTCKAPARRAAAWSASRVSPAPSSRASTIRRAMTTRVTREIADPCPTRSSVKKRR